MADNDHKIRQVPLRHFKHPKKVPLVLFPNHCKYFVHFVL
jgi:hypothetical protein